MRDGEWGGNKEFKIASPSQREKMQKEWVTLKIDKVKLERTKSTVRSKFDTRKGEAYEPLRARGKAGHGESLEVRVKVLEARRGL